MAVFQNGDNWQIEEDSNGDYVVTYLPTDTVIERIDSGNKEKIFEVATRISDLVDDGSGSVVYDSSAEEVKADVNNESLSTEQATITNRSTGHFVAEQPGRHFQHRLPVGDGWTRNPNNPILTAGSNTFESAGVADPELLWVPDYGPAPIWLFYEGLEGPVDGQIGLAFLDRNGDSFSVTRHAQNAVFNEYSHQSYPAVERVGDTVYMLPQTGSRPELWKTTVQDLADQSTSVSWTQVTQIDFPNHGTADARMVERNGLIYLFINFNSSATPFIRVFVVDDREDWSAPIMVGEILPNLPDGELGARSPYITDIGDAVIYHTQRNDQAGIHGGIITDLSPSGFTLKYFSDNPSLAPSASGWESEDLHALSVINDPVHGDYLGAMDGRDSTGGGNWEIGVVTQEVS